MRYVSLLSITTNQSWNICERVTYSFCLWNPESQSSHSEAKASKQEIRSIARLPSNRLEHDGRDPSHHQIPQPLRSSRNTNGIASQPVRGDLTNIYPAHRSPTELESCGEKVHHDESRRASVGDRSASLGRVEAHVEAEIEHEDAHGEASPDEGQSAAQGVGEEEDEDAAAAHLDDAVHTGC